MSTLRCALAGVLLTLFAPGSRAAPDGGTPLRTRVQELVEMMATGDDASRASAADELVSLGRPAVPEVGRFAHLLRDVSGRDAAVGALARIGVDESIALLGAYRSVWAESGDAEAGRLVAALRARRDPKLRTEVDLVPVLATNAARVPPDAEFAVTDSLPESLAWGKYAVRKSKGGISIDVDESGRAETIDPDRPRAVRVGPRRRPLLVYRRLDRWYAASASLLAGKMRGGDVELWDADLDGEFTGPRDFVRLGDGAFQRIPADGLVQSPQGLATMSVRATATGATASFVPEPLPESAGDWTLRAVATLNEWRRGVGLPPVLLDFPRSAMCAKHVDYWRLNGYSAHDEDKTKPGWSAEGAQAGRKSSVWDTPDAAKLIRVISATALHRATCLGASIEGVGIALGSGSCVWGGETDATDRGFPLLVPGPGQDTVPNVAESEKPPPDRDANFYVEPRGYPVTVMWRRAWDDVKKPRLELLATGPGGTAEPVAGDVFSPDDPYTSKGRPIELFAITFVAAKALDRHRTYIARFRGDRDSGPAEFSWSFTTK